jgi:hypothetical protein
MIVIGISLLVALVGLLMYCLSANAKVSAIGFAMFQIGLLAFLLTWPGHALAIAGH